VARVADADEVEAFTAERDEVESPARVEEVGDALDPSARETITVCSCGMYNGSQLYVGVDCAGFPSPAVCCAQKCGELTAALDSQH